MAAEVLGHLQRQAWIDKVTPPVEQVQPGLWSIPVEIPIKPLRYVLVYVLETSDGIAIIDSGWNDQQSYDTLVAGLAQGGYALGDIKKILITHAHPDHFGLAQRLREETGAPTVMHRAEAEDISREPVSGEEITRRILTHATRQGVLTEDIEKMRGEASSYSKFVRTFDIDQKLDDGERIDLAGWELDGVWTPGHTPGHMCFVDATRKVMFTGDHVLPRITPNISVHASSSEDSLQKYLDSLTKVAKVADTVADLQGLPGHEYRYAGIRARAEELIDHHEHRLSEVMDVLRDQSSITATEVSQRLTWARDFSSFGFPERRAALGEAISHLLLLQQRGLVARAGDEVERWSIIAR